MATRMQQRRGTAAQWISVNNGDGPILEAGEIGFEIDTNKFKIGDGINHWIDLTYFTDAESVLDAVNNLVDGAPDLLNTLNEIASALGDDPNFFTTVATNLSNHESDTTNIHGIADTAELATKTFAAELLTNATKTNITITGDKNGLTITAENGVGDSTTDNLSEGTTNKYFTDERAQDAVGNSVGTGLSYDDASGSISVTANTYDAYGSASAVSTDLSNHESATLNVHGIADTDELATKAYVADAISNATVDQSALAGVGIDWNINDEQFDIDSTVTTNTGTQTLENKTISYVNNTITVQVDNVDDLTATAAELNTLDGITADVNELNILDGITASTAELNILDGVTATTAELNILDGATLDVTELNYLDGVTSSVQAQLDDKLSKTGGTMTGDLTLAGAPTQALHAATKAYVDGVTEGLHIHEAVVAATTANIDLSTDLENGDVVDGITLVTGNRVLVKSQTDKTQNGIYVVQASGAAVRAADFDSPAEIDSGDFVFVNSGTANGDTGWVQINTVGTVGTDNIEFTQFSGAGTFLAGNGLDLDGNTFSIDTSITVDTNTAQTLTNKTISAANNTLNIAPTDLDGVTATAAEINILDGATLDVNELNVLDGITASTAELNILDGITATTAELNVLDGITANVNELNILDGVTATALELNVLDGITATTAELNYVDGVTSGIQAQLDSKASLSGSETLTNKTISSPTFTGTLTLPNSTVVTTGTTTISVNTATTIDTNELNSFTTAEYVLSLKQGSKIRSSKVIIQTDGTSVDSSEFGITETGGEMTGVSVTAIASGGDALLHVTVTDAGTTNVNVKFTKVVL